MDAANAKLNEARAHHRAGKLPEAEAGYRALTVETPELAKPWWLLGLLSHQQGRIAEAITCLEQAISLAPTPAWLVHLGNALLDSGDYASAAEKYHAAISRDETTPHAHSQLGLARRALGDLPGAATAFRTAIRQTPTDELAWSQLSSLLLQTSRLHDARELATEWHKAMPRCVAALAFAGQLELELGNATAAMQFYRAAIELEPSLAPLHFNLGTVLNVLGQFSSAEECFTRALELDPTLHMAATSLSSCQAAQGDISSARASCRRAAAMQPEFPFAALREKCILPDVYESEDEIDAFRAELLAELEAQPALRWPVSLAQLESMGIYPSATLMYHGRDDRPIKERFANLLAKHLPNEEHVQRAGRPHLGMLVTRGHEGIFVKGTRGLLRQWDQESCEVSIFCAASGQEYLVRELAQTCCRIVPMPPGIDDSAKLLRAAQLDLLYFWEIGSDNVNYMLPLAECAPVQMTSWGWPVTSGMSRVDYFLSSTLIEPPNAVDHYVESLIQLPCLPNVYERPRVEHIAASGELLKRRTGERIYYCSQNPLKIHPAMDALFREILEVDGSGVIALIEASRPHVTAKLQARLERTLPGLTHRVRWLPRMSRNDYLRTLAAADVCLDTLHYGGGANSIYDAVALGTPLVTLPTEFHRGRYGAAVCRLLDLPALVASRPDEYARMATELARDADRRAEVSCQLRDRSEVIFNDHSAARHIQEALLKLMHKGRES